MYGIGFSFVQLLIFSEVKLLTFGFPITIIEKIKMNMRRINIFILFIVLAAFNHAVVNLGLALRCGLQSLRAFYMKFQERFSKKQKVKIAPI